MKIKTKPLPYEQVLALPPGSRGGRACCFAV